MGLLADFNLEYQYAPTTYEKFSTFAPVFAPQRSLQMDYSYAPNIQIDSPGAVGSTITTKKEMKATQDVTGATTSQDPSVSQVGPSSDPMGMILILGLVAVGGYVLTGYLKKKKR